MKRNRKRQLNKLVESSMQRGGKATALKVLHDSPPSSKPPASKHLLHESNYKVIALHIVMFIYTVMHLRSAEEVLQDSPPSVTTGEQAPASKREIHLAACMRTTTTTPSLEKCDGN